MDEEKSIDLDIDIDYTLPVLSHSVGIATRTLSARYGEQVHYIPDYGGVVEIPDSFAKNNGLATGIPFRRNPKLTTRLPIINGDHLLEPNDLVSPPNNCIIAARYLDVHTENEFSTISALGANLYMNSVSVIRQPGKPKQFETKLYHQTHFASDILNLRYQHDLKDKLLVIFNKGLKVVQLSTTIDYDDESSKKGNEPYKVLRSIPAGTSNIIKDSCLNHFNERILGIGSENGSKHEIKFYDINESGRFYHMINWESDETSAWPPVYTTKIKQQSYSTMKPVFDEIIQLSNIPSHMVNMIALTDYSARLIDPRLQEVGGAYIEKSRSFSSFPMERYAALAFSLRNENQFYCLSDHHLRSVDMRYPTVPVNQLMHLLSPDDTKNTNVQIIDMQSISGTLETVCMSIPDRLCFTTFDHDNSCRLINPKSKHQPVHEKNFTDEHRGQQYLYGLAIMFDDAIHQNSDDLFSILQLDEEGFITVKEFISYTNEIDDHQDVDKEDDLRWTALNEIVRSVTNTDEISRFRLRRLGHKNKRIDDTAYIDLLCCDKIEQLKEGLESNRARDLLQKMNDRILPPTRPLN